MGKLSNKRIKYKYDGYLAEWSFIVDQDHDLWVKRDDLLTMRSEYDGGLNTIHVYGDEGWLIVDLTRCADSWVVGYYDTTEYIIVDEVIDD